MATPPARTVGSKMPKIPPDVYVLLAPAAHGDIDAGRARGGEEADDVDAQQCCTIRNSRAAIRLGHGISSPGCAHVARRLTAASISGGISPRGAATGRILSVGKVGKSPPAVFDSRTINTTTGIKFRYVPTRPT